MAQRYPHSGFTLIELMIVVAIAAVLAAIAWPSFQDAVRKSRRSDAMAGLSRIAQAQERWRANNPSYQATLPDLPGMTLSGTAVVSPDAHYTLSLDAVTAAGYTAVATARSSQQRADTGCSVMTLALAGGNISYSSFASGSSTANTPDRCWAR